VNRFLMAFVALVMTLGYASSAEAAPGVKNLKDCDGVYSGTYKNVTVQPGASCTLTPAAVVTGGVHAKAGAANLFVETAVGRNIQALGVTGTVYVGPGPDESGKLCTFDPPVRNNVMVKKSHNVLICWVTSGNNIKVTGNSGQVTVRNSHADNNLTVSRNVKYTGGKTKHRHPEWVRVLNNTYGNHLTAVNPERPKTVLKGNTQS
jgi:hypothetical protein